MTDQKTYKALGQGADALSLSLSHLEDYWI